MALSRQNKDLFVTETFVMLAKLGDFFLTVDSNLDSLKRSGLEQLTRMFGADRVRRSGPASAFFRSHRQRFDRDMSRIFRYSSVTTIYTFFETTASRFIADFTITCPGKPTFKLQKQQAGFVANFRAWLETAPDTVKVRNPRIWNQLDDLRVIRNCVTHANGVLSLCEKRSKIGNVVDRTRNVHFDKDGILVVERRFPFTITNTVETFFRFLFRECGYGLLLPPSVIENAGRSLNAFEDEIIKGIQQYDLKQTINLGGNL